MNADGGNLPGGFKNISNTTQSSGTVQGIAPGQVFAHPGANNEFSIVRFTAPTSGLFAVSSVFTGIDCCFTNTDVYVIENGSTALFSDFVYGFGASKSYGGDVFLNAGGVVDFVVGSNGSYYYDSTALNVSVDAMNTAPEPASIALFATGLLGVGGVVRRRRR